MPRSLVMVLAWVVAGAFVLATVLQLVDRLNLVATPPLLPDNGTMVTNALATVEYRQAIWPVFLWTNLLFGIGFAAAVAFAAVVAAARGVGGSMPVFVALVTIGGIIGAMASVIPLGAVNGAVWVQYCDCGFKDTEIVSQQWAGMVAFDISDWFNRFASAVLGFGLIAFVREAAGTVSPALRSWTYLTAAALLVAPVIATVGVFEVLEVLTAILGLILIPVWAIWAGRPGEHGPELAGA